MACGCYQCTKHRRNILEHMEVAGVDLDVTEHNLTHWGNRKKITNVMMSDDGQEVELKTDDGSIHKMDHTGPDSTLYAIHRALGLSN